MPPDHNLAFRLLEKIDPRFRQKEEQKAIITIEQVVRHVSQIENQGAREWGRCGGGVSGENVSMADNVFLNLNELEKKRESDGAIHFTSTKIY